MEAEVSAKCKLQNMRSKERKRKELRTIAESAGQGKISFAKLPRWV